MTGHSVTACHAFPTRESADSPPLPSVAFVKYLVTEMRDVINILPLSKPLGKLIFSTDIQFCHIKKRNKVGENI